MLSLRFRCIGCSLNRHILPRLQLSTERAAELRHLTIRPKFLKTEAAAIICIAPSLTPFLKMTAALGALDGFEGFMLHAIGEDEIIQR